MSAHTLPTIGFSACFFHADPQRAIFKGKTLLYAEESMFQWVMNEGAIPFLLPRTSDKVTTADLVARIDGLLLQGGSDVCPKSYGEEPLKPEWNGDFERDQYEIELIQECLAQKKPILGICRGLQIMNVAFGGTLYQDTSTQRENVLVHRDWQQYDQLFHEINFEAESSFHQLYPGQTGGTVNSVHHQSIKELGKDLVCEATSTEDQVIEAIRLQSDEQYAFAVQWHPEFQTSKEQHLLSTAPLIKDFLQAVRKKQTYPHSGESHV